MSVLVQQLSALLKGGRSVGSVWEELWLLHGARYDHAGSDADHAPVPTAPPPGPAPGRRLRPRTEGGPGVPSLSAGSLELLSAARAAAGQGAPVGGAIRRRLARDDGIAAVRRQPAGQAWERGVWLELAACFDIAEASGCPLADILTRYGAHLEAGDDAAGARRTALAGPKATAAILTWLPFAGLALAMLLGVDAAGVLLGTPLGLLCLAAGAGLAAVGRIWSGRLVRSAEGHLW